MFPRLFSPLAVGRVRLPNRIVSSGHSDCLAPRTVEEAVLDGLVAASGI